MRRPSNRLSAIFGAAVLMASKHPAAAQTGVPSDEQPDRDAIARVAYAEAANQGDSGRAAVVRVILNRLVSGRWGSRIETVVNAKGQFEPVARAGGDWRRLSRVSPTQQAKIDTIINLTLEGRLPDLTSGAIYFQNPKIVADRARLGLAPASLVKFGMSRPSAVIGSHWFFRSIDRSSSAARINNVDAGPIFVRAAATAATSPQISPAREAPVTIGAGADPLAAAGP